MAKIKRPNFMCIGATKSATTTLFEILKQHSMIGVSSFKEPHFFDNTINYEKGIDWYLMSYFSHLQDEEIIAEFTPSYLSCTSSPERIFDLLGSDIKFLVILRNPIDRAYSHFLHTKRDQHEDLSFIDAINNEEKRLNKFSHSNDDISFARFSYVYQGLYAKHINTYLNIFPRKQFKFILFDDLVSDINKSVERILRFLNLDINEDLNLNIITNQSSVARSKKIKHLIRNDSFFKRFLKFIIPSLVFRQRVRNTIHSLNNKTKTKSPLSKDDRIYIYNNFFKQEIIELEKMLNLDLNYWKEC